MPRQTGTSNNNRGTWGSTFNPTPAMEEIMGRLNSTIPTPAMTAIRRRRREKWSSSPLIPTQQDVIRKGSLLRNAQQDSVEYEDEEESEEEEEDNKTQCPLYQKCPNCSKTGDPFATPRQYNSPASSTYSTPSNVESPSFRHSREESHVFKSHIIPKLLAIGLIGGIAVLAYYKAMDFDDMSNDLAVLTCPLKYFEFMTMGLDLQFTSKTYTTLIATLALTILSFALYKMLMCIRRRKQREETEFFDLIESIIALLKQQYERNEVWAINHIRDEIFNVRERKGKETLWNNAVNYISSSESRVRTEIQTIAGEEFRVWRWLPLTIPLTTRLSSTPASRTTHL